VADSRVGRFAGWMDCGRRIPL
jgi:hypothetical protein